MDQDLKTEMVERARLVEAALDTCLVAPTPGIAALARLDEAVRHGCLGGGKRLRPFLLIESAVMTGARVEAALPAACAIEMVHSYSLVHDDLPAMDDADTRRGQPSVHKAFGEATGILAGDSLLTDAFLTLAAATSTPADVTVALVGELARAAGSAGMVGGQMMDLHPAGSSEQDIIGIQQRKTGALIEAAAVMGGLVGGASANEIAALRRYAAAIGLAFQVVDDILDVTQSAEALGKPAGADAAAGKATFVSLLGLEGARAKVRDITAAAEDALAPFGDRAAMLAQLAGDLELRTH